MLENLLVSPLVLGLLALRRLLALLGVLWLLSRVLPPNVLLSTVVLLAVLRRLFLLLSRLFLLFSVCFFTRTFLTDRFDFCLLSGLLSEVGGVPVLFVLPPVIEMTVLLPLGTLHVRTGDSGGWLVGRVESDADEWLV